VRPLWGQSTPAAGDILAAHEAKHLDHLVSRSSYRVKFLFQLSKRVPAKSFSVGRGWPGAAWMACADKAHVSVCARSPCEVFRAEKDPNRIDAGRRLWAASYVALTAQYDS